MRSTENVIVMDVNHCGRRIRLHADPRKTILEIRKIVNSHMDIPLGQWCLTSCGAVEENYCGTVVPWQPAILGTSRRYSYDYY